jgi:hypothetical protein
MPDAPTRSRIDAEARAKALVDHIGHFVNGMSSDQADAFATALANEHPTLLGQIAKAVGIGVMRRATHEHWRPFDAYERSCRQSHMIYSGFPQGVPAHADHDGRLDCTTVIGAELMARQSYI